jgi:hypothetical protein
LTCHIFRHIYAPILLIFHPFPKKNQAALVTSTHSKRTGRYVGRTRSVPSTDHISRQIFSLGDGTELRLDGDVPVIVNISV